MGLFDKVCSAETMLRHPKLYSQGSNNFNVKVFWIWIANAMFHSVLLFWLPLYAVKHDIIWSNAMDGGYLVLGNIVYTVSNSEYSILIQENCNMVEIILKLKHFLS